jgi:uncharacterized protein with HEPN domain
VDHPLLEPLCALVAADATESSGERADCRGDLLSRSAVERQLEILGEALARALRADPDLAAGLPAVRGAIDFRNVIAHAYDALSPAAAWDLARYELPVLARQVAGELAPS